MLYSNTVSDVMHTETWQLRRRRVCFNYMLLKLDTFFNIQLQKCPEVFHISLTSKICDPPQENREKGDDMGTRAMTQHTKRVTIARICAYLISKTKGNTVPFVCRANAYVPRSVLEDTLNV